MRKLVGVLVAVVLLASSAPAIANQYEIFIDVENEEDLYDLRAAGQITDDTFNTLVELFQRGVNLNTGSREDLYSLPNLTYAEVDSIIAFRTEAGYITDPSVLAKQKILSQKKFVAIAAFLVIRNKTRRVYATTGRLRAQSVWTSEDDRVPATALSVRLRTLKHLNVAVLGTVTRNWIGESAYDAGRDALLARGASTRLEIPKFYAQWKDDNVNVIVGNFTAGFGERLVFDTTPRQTPNGIYPDDNHRRDTDLTRECKLSTGERGTPECQAVDRYVTPDFKWTEYSMGAAVGLTNLKLGPGHAQAYAWVSLRSIDVYQYQLYDKGKCTDPRMDEDDNCGAPDVYDRQDSSSAPSDRHSFQTLPGVMKELLVGGNVAYRPQRRVQFGITGYGSNTESNVDGIDLDWQEWSSRPFGGSFGALGVSAALGRKWLDVFIEIAHSFDSMDDGGGGPAGTMRVVASKNKQELETSFRYYDEKFKNPFGGGYAQPDTLDGRRDRDEIGGRVRYNGVFQKKLRLRAQVDLWKRPAIDRYKTEIRLRADVQASKVFGYGLWLEHDNRDIGKGPLQCDNNPNESSADPDATISSSSTSICGRGYNATARVNFKPHKKWRVTGQYRHSMVEDSDSTRGTFLRQDLSTWATVFFKATSKIAARARMRYFYEDIKNKARGEQSIWFYTNLRYRVQKKQWIEVRYDARKRLDDRQSTMDRVPQTESWLWAQYTAKF